MSVFYCIPTYKSFDECRVSVQSALNSSVIPDQIVIIDNSGNGSGALALNDLVNDRVHIWPQSRNIGVAASWNMFHRELRDDYVIIANDDVTLHHNTIEYLIKAADKHGNEQVLFTGAGESGNAFSLFLLTKRGYSEVGPFDERFWPAYFEDNDYARRLYLRGYIIVPVTNATYDHVVSSTLKKYTPAEMDLHHNRFRANRAYYIHKWGGEPYYEVYDKEFDGLL